MFKKARAHFCEHKEEYGIVAGLTVSVVVLGVVMGRAHSATDTAHLNLLDLFFDLDGEDEYSML